MGNIEKDKIVKLLKSHPRGLTITDLAKKVSCSRHTITVALAELVGSNKIEVRKVNMAKLHYWKK